MQLCLKLIEFGFEQDGPSSFIAAEKMTIKSSDVKPLSVNSWDNESTIKVSHSRKASEPKGGVIC